MSSQLTSHVTSLDAVLEMGGGAKQGSGGTEKLGNLPKVAQQVRELVFFKPRQSDPRTHSLNITLSSLSITKNHSLAMREGRVRIILSLFVSPVTIEPGWVKNHGTHFWILFCPEAAPLPIYTNHTEASRGPLDLPGPLFPST